MKTLQRIISTGFAAAALATASVPALAYTVWPDVDFEWYANVGKPAAGSTIEVYPAPREGYIWSPGHWETRGTEQAWVNGQWIADDYNQQLAIRDREGNVIPTSPDAYPVDSARR
jgi:hypothetical protein